jgi:hypothetical protein
LEALAPNEKLKPLEVEVEVNSHLVWESKKRRRGGRKGGRDETGKGNRGTKKGKRGRNYFLIK